MYMQLLKPLNGWRRFAGEVGVIVLGVLLALGAQQTVESIQARADERAFRETINHEIGLNLFIYDVRARQFACAEKRVAELKSWLGRTRDGEQVPALRPTALQILTPYRSGWDNRDAQVFNRLPAKLRQKYAEFYDELSNNWALMEEEQEQWVLLLPYAEPGLITLADRRTVFTIAARASSYNALLQGNLPIAVKIAEALGAKQVPPDNIPAEWINELSDCPSVIAAPAGASRDQ